MKRQQYQHPSDTSETAYSTDSSESSYSQCCNIRAYNTDVAQRKKPSPSEGEAAVTRDLNKLSIQQRGEVYEEIHGIRNANPNHETPEMITEAIQDLQDCLHRMKRTEKQAYELALLMSPSFVRNREFVLMFLRADFFDIRKTAARFVSNFRVKLDLFGIDKLVKHITWDDLGEDDRAAVLNCSSQHFPELKDASGRTVWVAAMGKDEYKTESNHLRCSWYNVMGFMLGNDHAQTHGIVGVAHMIALSAEKSSNTLMKRSMDYIAAMPFRYAALHICYDNPALRTAVGLIQLLANMQTRIRFRAHFGTHMECMHSLMTFGIDQSTFPLDEAGNIREERFLAHLALLKTQEAEVDAEKEAHTRESGLIDYPISGDVLFGRGKALSDFEGNQRMFLFIDSYKRQYALANTKDEKTLLAETVLMMVKEHKGRFLKRAPNESDGWVAVADKVAREKISHAFRTRLK